MKLREQQLGGRSLYQDASTLRVLLGGMSLPAGAVSSAWYRIWLVHVDGSDPDDYDVDDTGLAAANAAASSGDDILIPPYASFTSNYTITAGVAFIGQSPYATKFTGQITLGAGSYIKDCGINRSGSSTGTNVGIVGPGSGKGYIISCSVIVDQNGAGNAVGLQIGAGEIDSRESYFYGDAASGTGYGITGDGGACNLSAGCWARGTTAPTDGDEIYGITFDNYIRLLDDGGNLVELFPATATGLGDAITAAQSGNIIDGPKHITIALTAGITIPASVLMRNFTLSFSGFDGTAITTSALSGLLDSYIAYVVTGANDSNTILASGVGAGFNNLTIYMSGGTGDIKGMRLSGPGAVARATANNCYVDVDGSTATDAEGVYILDHTYIINVRTSVAGASNGNTGIGFGGTAQDQCYAFQCYGIAAGTGSRGGLLYSGKYATIYNSIFVGTTAGFDNVATAEGIFGASSWNSYTGTGTRIELWGDRGAWDITTYEDRHASDINADTMLRHMPAAGTAGNIAEDDGTNWVSVPFAGVGWGYSYDVDNISNPPLESELITALGAIATFGTDNMSLLNDNNAELREYLVVSDDTRYWFTPKVKALPDGASYQAAASNSSTYLTTPTYDGDDECVHPSIYYNAMGWNGYKYWMAMTPYPGSDSDYENPSILVSNDGNLWAVPAGLTNPIDPKPATQNSDTALLVAHETMYCYYRETTNLLRCRTSTDGATWSDEIAVLTATLISPAVLLVDGTYYLWYIDIGESPNVLYRRSSLYPTSGFGAATGCTVNGVPGASDLWHLSIIKRGSLYHAFIVLDDLDADDGTGSELWFATSDDGLTWTMGSAALIGTAGSSGWDDTLVYHGSGVGTSSGYDLWYSGFDNTDWHVGRTTVALK